MMEMPDIIGQTQDSAVQELATKGLNATCFTVVNDGSEAAGCVVSASEDAGSMVEVGTTIVLYIAGDVPADAPAGSEAPSDTGTPPAGMPRRAAWNTIRIKQKEAAFSSLLSFYRKLRKSSS